MRFILRPIGEDHLLQPEVMTGQGITDHGGDAPARLSETGAWARGADPAAGSGPVRLVTVQR
jgi:hypothetical protein